MLAEVGEDQPAEVRITAQMAFEEARFLRVTGSLTAEEDPDQRFMSDGVFLEKEAKSLAQGEPVRETVGRFPSFRYHLRP